MVIHAIIESARPGISNPTISIIGDIYTYMTIPVTMPLPPLQHLPHRVVADLQFRNDASAKAGLSTHSYWRLTQASVRIGLADIKGRWYESSTLLPILQNGNFVINYERGEVSDTGPWMNGRGEGKSNYGIRKSTRREALGRAVPQHTQISRGLEGPPEENHFPEEMGTQANPITYDVGVGGRTDLDIDQYMQLDQDEFMQQFGGQFYGDTEH